MTLFTVDNPERIATCLPLLGADDALLLMDGACGWHPTLPPASACHTNIYALMAPGESGIDGITAVDYSGWVTLTEAHVQHVHWR